MTDQIAPARPADGAAHTSAVNRVARGSSINLVGAGVSAVTNFGLTIVVARGLTQSEAGVFFSATSIFLLATTIGQLGTGTGLVYFFSRCRALGTVGRIAEYWRAAIRPVMVTAIVMAVVVFVLAPELARWSSPEHAGQATTYLRILAIFIPLAGLENLSLAATRGLGTMRANALVEQLGRPILQLALVFGAVYLQGTGILGWAWVVAYLPAAIVGWLWWERRRPRAAPAVDPSAADAVAPTETAGGLSASREFWRFTAPRALASVAQLAMQRLDIILVGALAGATQAAIYTAATRFIVAGQMGSYAVSLAFQPALAKSLAHEDHTGAHRLYQISTAWVIAITWPMYLTLVVFGGPLLHVFGAGYAEGATVLMLISISMLVSTLCGDVDVVLIMAGRTAWSLENLLLALAINVGLDVWLIPGHGVLGAAIGWSVAIVVKNLAALFLVVRSLRLQPIGRATIVAVAINLAWLGLVPLVARLLLGSTAVGLVAGVGVGLIGYAGCLLLFRNVLQLDSLRSLRRGGKPAAKA